MIDSEVHLPSQILIHGPIPSWPPSFVLRPCLLLSDLITLSLSLGGHRPHHIIISTKPITPDQYQPPAAGGEDLYRRLKT